MNIKTNIMLMTKKEYWTKREIPPGNSTTPLITITDTREDLMTHLTVCPAKIVGNEIMIFPAVDWTTELNVVNAKN